MQSATGSFSSRSVAETQVSVEDSHPPRPLWFADLITLMAPGGGEDRLRGEVLSHTDCHGVLRFRVSRRGRLVRCENPSGAVIYIAGHDTVWYRDGRDELQVERRRGDWFPIPDDFEFGARRLGRDRWSGDDFTRPTGPAREVSFLDRPAWQIELAPPRHKPHPMQLTIDQQTGLVLRQGNVAFGTFTEWTSLDLAAELPDDLFVWHDHSDVLAPAPEPLDQAEADPDWRERLQAKVPLLDAWIMSMDHFHEMHQLVAGIRDVAQARQLLMDSFGLTEQQAMTVLPRVQNPHARKPTEEERRRAVAHRAEVLRQLENDD